MFLSLVVFLLLTPQLSIHFSFFKLDSYILLLILLIIKFLRIKKHVIYKESFFFFFMIGLFFYLLLVQTLLSNTGVEIYAHTTYVDFRENDTYGLAPVQGLFDVKLLIKLFSMLIFSFLIYDYLKEQSVNKLVSFFKNILYTLAVIQVFFFIFNKLGIVENIIRLFFQDNVQPGGSLGIAFTIRDDYFRYSGGFAEPSHLAIIYFIAAISLFYLIREYKIKITLFSKVLIFLSWFVVLITTISFTHFLSLILVLFIILNLSRQLLAVGLVLFLLSFELIVILDLEFLKSINASFIARIYLNTNLETLSINQFLFGVGITNFYNFIISKNLILQLGFFGTIIWISILFRYFYDKNFLFILSILVILFISPRLSDVFLYIAFAFFLAIKYKLKTHGNNFKHNKEPELQ